MKKFLTAAIAIAVLSACQGETADSGLNASIEKRGEDVTVLQAWLGQTVSLDFTGHFGGDYRIKPSDCVETSRRPYNGNNGQQYFYVTTNCASAIENAMKMNGQRSPLIGSAPHTYYDYPNQGQSTTSGMCEMVEFRTITPDASLDSPAFKGIGFYYSRSQSELIKKDRLHKVGHVTLKNGAPATVHRFIAQGMCFGLGGNGGTIADRQYKFRPFAQFDGFDGNLYSVWDSVDKDYLLGRDRENFSSYVFVKEFDRQQELLKQ